MSDDKNFDPWSSPKEPKKKASNPGNRGANSGNSSGGRGTPPNMDDVFKKFASKANGYFDGPKGPKRLIATAALAIFALWVVFGSVFIVSTAEEGVVLRFGSYDRTVDEGLSFKFPPPFERVYIRNVDKINEINVGRNKVNEEGLIVTGDENIIDTEIVVQWKIKSLKDYLFNVRDADEWLSNASESGMREVIGNVPISFALGEGSGRAKIAQEVQDVLQEMLDSYGTGIEIVGVQLKSMDVPPDVIDAQIDVQNAKTEQERVKNEAEAYSNDIIPRARGEAQKKLHAAEAYKESVLSKAKGESSRFLAVYEQYKQAKDVTKRRIYLETMQEIFKDMDKIILDDQGKVMPYLPIDKFGKKGGNANAQ